MPVAALVAALRVDEAIAALEAELGVSFAADEGPRFVHRARFDALTADAIGRSETRTEMLGVESLRRYALAAGADPGVERALPTSASKRRRCPAATRCWPAPSPT